ncbi:uncharacterized protein DC041_0008378, partial [Schistosoma bovis]
FISIQHFIMVHKQIQIYKDLGTSEQCYIHLKNAFQYLTSLYKIEEINSTIINNQNIQSNLLCFGGGYDLGYLNLLQLSGCLNIHNYIKENMGRYLGICAGAYFACDYCYFDMNGPLEVYGERYIKLFQGLFSDNGKPAIIGSKLGNGCGILSGVHFEYDPYLLEKQIYNVDPENNVNSSLSQLE